MALVPGGEQFPERNAAGVGATGLDAGDGRLGLYLPAIGFGHDAGNGAAVAGDDDGLAALDLVEQAGQVRLRLVSLYFHIALSV